MKVWFFGALLVLAMPVTATPWAATALDAGLGAHAAGDYAAARQHFDVLADHGSVIAETMLGTMYARGQGVVADAATAAAYWFRAASRGYAPAQLAIARVLATGKGIGQDKESAWVWAQLAAARGDAVLRGQALELATGLEANLAPSRRSGLERRVEAWQPWSE